MQPSRSMHLRCLKNAIKRLRKPPIKSVSRRLCKLGRAFFLRGTSILGPRGSVPIPMLVSLFIYTITVIKISKEHSKQYCPLSETVFIITVPCLFRSLDLILRCTAVRQLMSMRCNNARWMRFLANISESCDRNCKQKHDWIGFVNSRNPHLRRLDGHWDTSSNP